MTRIRFTNLFAERIGGVSSVDVHAATVESALRALTDRHPSLTPLVWKDGAFLDEAGRAQVEMAGARG